MREVERGARPAPRSGRLRLAVQVADRRVPLLPPAYVRSTLYGSTGKPGYPGTARNPVVPRQHATSVVSLFGGGRRLHRGKSPNLFVCRLWAPHNGPRRKFVAAP